MELAELREESESGSLSAPKAAEARLRGGRWLWTGISILVIGTIAVGTWLSLRPAPSQLPSWRLRQLTSDDGVSVMATLSPDRKLVAFVSDRAGRGQMDLFIQQGSGGSPVRLTDGKQKVNAIAFTPGGMQIIYGTMGRDSAIWGIPAIGGEPRRITDRGANESTLKVSPDGKWICSYGHFGNWRGQCRITLLAGGESKLFVPKVFQDGNFIWSPDSQGLLLLAGLSQEAFIGGDTDLWFVSIDGAASPTGVGQIAMYSELRSLSPLTWTGTACS